jgi:adenylate cyclase class IV
MAQIEIEIKSLLGEKSNADKLKESLKKRGFDLANVKKSSQLNHYFTYKSLEKFKEEFLKVVQNKEGFESILNNGKDFSIRTRESNGNKVILVIKASLGNDSSQNGVSRMEFEEVVNMTLNDLDQKLVDCGLEYQAKWSREREEFKNGTMAVCVDKNAGYGYLAEFEVVTESEKEIDKVKTELLNFMSDIGIEELKQDRLERMFDFYNKNWPNYYGTDNIFTIE